MGAVSYPSLAAAVPSSNIVVKGESMPPSIGKNVGIIDVPIEKEGVATGKSADNSADILAGVDYLNHFLPVTFGQFVVEDFRSLAPVESYEHADLRGWRFPIVPIEIFDWSWNFDSLPACGHELPLKMCARYVGTMPNVGSQFLFAGVISATDQGIGGTPKIDGRNPKNNSVNGDNDGGERDDRFVVDLDEFACASNQSKTPERPHKDEGAIVLFLLVFASGWIAYALIKRW
jgi:hypothetical protein